MKTKLQNLWSDLNLLSLILFNTSPVRWWRKRRIMKQAIMVCPNCEEIMNEPEHHSLVGPWLTQGHMFSCTECHQTSAWELTTMGPRLIETDAIQTMFGKPKLKNYTIS